MPQGYFRTARVLDATRRSSWEDPLDVAALRNSLGGAGLGTQILLDREMASIDPLGEDAALVFAFSPLVGSPLTTSAKFAVVSKSPLTERINDSLASSSFAIRGKATGSDALVVTGQSPTPVIAVVDESTVTWEPADDLWGKTCADTEHLLKQRFGRDCAFAVIGPAGEQCIPFATISHDGRHAGRGGSGAVLGSKRIKAIAVRGEKRCQWHNTEQLLRYAKKLSAKSLGPATEKYRELGTATNLLLFNRLKTLPTRNFQASTFAGAENLSPESLEQERGKTRASCAACTIGCEHLYSLGSRGKVRVEYENLYALGALCDVSDADAVLQASARCDELGLDTISVGGTIAFAMECVQRGLLDAPWLQFGSPDALLKAIELIVQRDGVGELLAQGSRAMAESIGHDSIDFAPQVKGLELPGYEPRGLQAMALGFAVGTRGADHNRSGAYEVDFSTDGDRLDLRPELVDRIVDVEDKAALMDSLILCKFLRRAFSDFFEDSAEMLAMTTGWELTAEDMQQTARNIVNLRKRFNIDAGWTPAEDRLPKRMLQEVTLEAKEASLSHDTLSRVIRVYYRQRGWTDDGFLR